LTPSSRIPKGEGSLFDSLKKALNKTDVNPKEKGFLATLGMIMKQIKICKGITCSAKGSDAILHKIEMETGLQKGECNDKICLDICTCTGHCHRSPNIRVDDIVIHNITPENVMTEIENPTDFSDANTKELDLNIDELTKL